MPQNPMLNIRKIRYLIDSDRHTRPTLDLIRKMSGQEIEPLHLGRQGV